MALRQLYNITSGSGNPTRLTGLLPGGAGVQVTGNSTNPFISGPRIEEVIQEVFDVTASGSTVTPAASGKLLTLQPALGGLGAGVPGGATWAQNTIPNVCVGVGTFGIVSTPGVASEASASGGVSTGTKAQVVISGPVNALVTTSPTNTTAISAGMALAGDNAGNLTYAGASPNSGAVLATALGSMSASISAPTLMPVYIGGF